MPPRGTGIHRRTTSLLKSVPLCVRVSIILQCYVRYYTFWTRGTLSSAPFWDYPSPPVLPKRLPHCKFDSGLRPPSFSGHPPLLSTRFRDSPLGFRSVTFPSGHPLLLPSSHNTGPFTLVHLRCNSSNEKLVIFGTFLKLVSSGREVFH